MGNLIKDLWTYNYKSKQYFGICEVVLGDDLKQNRSIKKYETHIEKALKYTMEPKRKCLSHMSVQKYISYLKDGQTIRAGEEETYYPFTIEIEPRYESQYQDALGDAYRLIMYLIYELDVNEEDIIIMLNNSRSLYILVNPKTYRLKPSAKLHLIYKHMYEAIAENVQLQYVDPSMFSHYCLMKTPNTYYNGGYFVRITLEEFKLLYSMPKLKATLTSKKRSMDYDIPAKEAPGLMKLYEDAKESLRGRSARAGEYIKHRQLSYIKTVKCKCVEYIEENLMEKGCRNHALVSVAIYYKNQGYTQEQVLIRLMELANQWRHDETYSDLRSKVASIFRYDIKFSCDKAKQVLSEQLDMDDLCPGCPYNLKNSFRASTIAVSTKVISELWENNAGPRHYILYLELIKRDLLNKWFSPKELGIDDRTLRELCKLSKSLRRSREKGLVYIEHKTGEKGKTYYLPKEFVDNNVHTRLGEDIKHYFQLLLKGFKPFSRYILIRVSKNKLIRDLGYSDISGVYKLLKRLEESGMIVTKSNNVICLYYESYKLKDIQQYKIERDEHVHADQLQTDIKKAVCDTKSSVPRYTRFSTNKGLKEGNRNLPNDRIAVGYKQLSLFTSGGRRSNIDSRGSPG